MKEKRRAIEEVDVKKTMFYYELVGAVLIIISLTTLSKLGRVGNILTVIFKVLFGDFYFCILLFLVFLGFYYLICHDSFNYKSNRFIGFIFLFITICLFSQFSVHSYIKTVSTDNNSSYLTECLNVYKSYIDYSSADMTLGGGIINAFIFYILYYLLGLFGIILVSLIFLILSISLIFNISFFDVFKYIFVFFKKIFKYFYSFNSFFKYEIGTNDNIHLQINVFNKHNVTFTCDEIVTFKKLIDNYFTSSKNYKYLKAIISYNVFTIYIKEINVNLYELKKYITINKNDKFLISYINNLLVIMINSDKKYKLPIRNNIKDLTEKNKIFIGITYLNEREFIDLNIENNLMLISSKEVNCTKFIEAFISMLLYNYSLQDINIYLYDIKNLFMFHSMCKTYNDYDLLIENIKEEVDKINDYFEINNITSYKDYLTRHKLKKQIKRTILIINNLTVNDISYFEKTLLYLNSLSKKTGLFILYTYSNIKSNVVNSIFTNKLIFKIDETILKVIDDESDTFNNCLYLDNINDAFYITSDKTNRIASIILDNKEVDKINTIINKK